MKNNFLILLCVLLTQSSFGQAFPKEYSELVMKAFSFYQAKDYKASAFAYSDAFKANGWKGSSSDRYNAACCWALANYPDSAFFNLNIIVTKMNFINYSHITTDTDLKSLHADKRWQPLLDIIKANKEKAEVNLNKPLAKTLDSIFTEDQKYRLQMDEVEKKHGYQSKEMAGLWKIMQEKDSINLIKVTSILDKYGWLGADEVGMYGNLTLFLVIQHSNLKTMEKYLPMLKEAVKNKKAQAADLALLTDRVEMMNGRPQVYGSQLMGGMDGKPALWQILDESNVNKRRTEVGLQPLEAYLQSFGIEYKLPTK